MRIFLLDYGAGNVRSLINAVQANGHTIEIISSLADFESADKIIFPGVGDFGAAMTKLASLGYIEALTAYIQSNKPFLGICVGMQCLFSGSDESLIPGLGIIPGRVTKFTGGKPVPHIGWNTVACQQSGGLEFVTFTRYYFVHSYAFMGESDWVHSLTRYHDQSFCSSIRKGNVFATQFHPEKSGVEGLALLKCFLEYDPLAVSPVSFKSVLPTHGLSRRVVTCLDIRADDNGKLVVTKGDQYDVRDKGGLVRNLGDPVVMAAKYFQEGADEIAFLNITSFRNCPMADLPMLQVLKDASKSVFVPITIGGGIRDMVQPDGSTLSALEVAGEYFRSGADKVSIGSDAVYITEAFANHSLTDSSIQQIARVYGSQAVVVSIDPTRVYCQTLEDALGHHTISTSIPGPNGETLCWYQCTVKGTLSIHYLIPAQILRY